MKELTQARVEEWLSLVDGQFTVKDIWAELGVNYEENRSNLRVILHRLREKGVIAKCSHNGTYRKLETEVTRIDWQSADPGAVLPLKLPFEIHKYCKLYPKSIVIVAGEKNAGKTTFLYLATVLNMGMFETDLYNNETGAEQMQERFSYLDVPVPPPFESYERYDNFADVIHPEHLSIIDYLDTNSEVYLVGAEIDAIFRKLTTGVAIIGLQKPPPAKMLVRGKMVSQSRDLAYGGGFTAKRAALYISLGDYKCKLVYVKTPMNPRVNPNNMQWAYSVGEDGYFANIRRFYGEEVKFE